MSKDALYAGIGIDDSDNMIDRQAQKEKKSKKHKRQNREDDFRAEYSLGGSPGTEITEDTVKEKKSKKKKERAFEEEDQTIFDGINVDADTPKKAKKEKKQKKERNVDESAVFDEVTITQEDVRKEKKEKKLKKEKRREPEEVQCYTPTAKVEEAECDEETTGSKYWKRIDEEKWKSKVSGTKYAKISHFEKGGDSWGDQAAEVLGKVKGKGFVKAMQKLKRASWKGQGTIDTGINSVQFSDWED